MSSERSLSAAMRTASQDDVVRPFFAIYADFPSGAVRAWSGIGDLVFDGETWSGLGEFLELDLVEESVDSSASGVAVTVTGLASTFFSPIMLQDYHGNEGAVYFGAFDSSGNVIADPIVLFRGVLDTDEIVDTGSNSTVRISAEHRLADLLRPRQFRYTLESQHSLTGSILDRGFEFIPSLQDVEIKWGDS